MRRTVFGWLELAAAGLAVAIAIPAAAEMLFGDFYSGQECSYSASEGQLACRSYSETLLEHGIPGRAWAFLTVVAALIVLVPVAAASDVLGARRLARYGLWALAVLLFVAAFLTGFTVGPFILPSALLAVASAAASLRNRPPGRQSITSQ